MKAIVFRVAAAALVAASGAASAQVFGDMARVISATPVYERGAPQQECRPEQVTAYEQRPVQPAPPPPQGAAPSGAGAVIGAIVGGVIGHQFGNSSGGRDHGTAAGAVIGGLIGNQVEKDNAGGYQAASQDVPMERVPVTREVQRCREVPSPDRIVGYEVRYEYNGHEFSTRLPFDPGPEMAVNVEVRPPVAEAMAPRRPMYRGPY